MTQAKTTIGGENGAINGFSALYPRHVGGTRYRVLSLRSGEPTAHKVDLSDLSCTCPDAEYNVDGAEVCDHVAVALHAAPQRVSVSENLAMDLAGLVKDLDEAAEQAQDAASQFESGLVSQRSAEATDKTEPGAAVRGDPVTNGEPRDADYEQGTKAVGGPADMPHSSPDPDPDTAAETLQTAFDDVVPDMQTTTAGGWIWVQTGKSTPEEIPITGRPETWSTLLKDPEQMEYIHDDHAAAADRPGQWWKNAIQPSEVDSYINEVL